MKKVEMRKCVVCGKKFTPKAANATVCSLKCRKIKKAKLRKARSTSGKTEKVVKAKCAETINLKKPTKNVASKQIANQARKTAKTNIVNITPGTVIHFVDFSPNAIIRTALRILFMGVEKLSANTKVATKAKKIK